MRGLKDKVAIVAGAACDIGGATAVRFAEEGAPGVAADLNRAAAQSVVDEIQGSSREVTLTARSQRRRDDRGSEPDQVLRREDGRQ